MSKAPTRTEAERFADYLRRGDVVCVGYDPTDSERYKGVRICEDDKEAGTADE